MDLRLRCGTVKYSIFRSCLKQFITLAICEQHCFPVLPLVVVMYMEWEPKSIPTYTGSIGIEEFG